MSILKPVSAVITLGRDLPAPTEFLDAKTKQWVSVANKEEFKKANLKWKVDEAILYINSNCEDFKKLAGFEMSVDHRIA